MTSEPKLPSPVLLRMAICGLLLAAASCDVGSRLGDGVTKEGVLSLRPGLSRQEVVERIGEPLYEKKRQTGAKCGNEDCPTEAVTLVYGEPGPLLGGFEMSVLLENGRMVWAGIDEFDLGIYNCDRRECPTIWNEPPSIASIRDRQAPRPAPPAAPPEDRPIRAGTTAEPPPDHP